MNETFPLSELRRLATLALGQSNYRPPDSARVRAVPDTRTIRYYTTLGLIDPPAEMRGRTAFYRRRHLEQIVAIKQLQAANETLANIQGMMATASPAKVRKLAGIPSSFWTELANGQLDVDTAGRPSTNDTGGNPKRREKADAASRDHLASPEPSENPSGNQSGDFWATPPTRRPRTVDASSNASPPSHVRVQSVIELGDGMTLQVEGHLPNFQRDRILKAAAKLKEEVARQRNQRS